MLLLLNVIVVIIDSPFRRGKLVHVGKIKSARLDAPKRLTEVSV
jgi:hypothetical protein